MTTTGAQTSPTDAPPHVCFLTGVRSQFPLHPLRHRLKDRGAKATSELLQVLCCGEESAVFAFQRLAGDARLEASAHRVLARISEEEAYHEVMLGNFRASLPEPPQDEVLRKTMLRFFRSLGTRDLGTHFARLAALDSGVCLILSQLRRRGGIFASEAEISQVLTRIHREESVHVASSLGFAKRLQDPSRLLEVMSETRRQLAELMMFRADSLEDLGVDAARLQRQLLRVPKSCLR